MLSAAAAVVSSNRQQVAPAVPAASVAAPSPCHASPSLKVRSATVTPPCTRKIKRGIGGSASVAAFENTSS